MNGFRLALPEASSIAGRVDALFYVLLGLSAAVVLAVWIAMVWFAVKYRHGRRVDRSGLPAQAVGIEMLWTLVPFLMFIGVFAWSIKLFADMETPPAGAATIYVVAKQWMWKIQHPGGQREIDELHVPLGKPVRLLMTSQDVIHSFYVPVFRVKQDVLPGRYTQLWFEPVATGTFPLFCAEYCGSGHARMGGRVVVMAAADYAQWLAGHAVAGGIVAEGERVFRSAGCSGCHGEHASVHAPSLDGLYGRSVALAGGGRVRADETYLRDSILLPRKQVAAGYAAVMPSYQGQLEPGDVLALVAWIESRAQGAQETLHDDR
jgi:cytochrome c oxidase subunit 2